MKTFIVSNWVFLGFFLLSSGTAASAQAADGPAIVNGVGAGVVQTRSGTEYRDYAVAAVHTGFAHRSYEGLLGVAGASLTLGEGSGRFLVDLDFVMRTLAPLTDERRLCFLGLGPGVYTRIAAADTHFDERSGAGLSLDAGGVCGKDGAIVSISAFGELGPVRLAAGIRGYVSVSGVELQAQLREQLRLGAPDGSARSELGEKTVQLRSRIPLGTVAAYLGLEGKQEHVYAATPADTSRDSVTLGLVAGGAF